MCCLLESFMKTERAITLHAVSPMENNLCSFDAISPISRASLRRLTMCERARVFLQRSYVNISTFFVISKK